MTDAETPISDDLKTKISALKALTCTLNLLRSGTFVIDRMQELNASINFILEIYSKLLNETLDHPDSDKVPFFSRLQKTKSRGEKTKCQHRSRKSLINLKK